MPHLSSFDTLQINVEAFGMFVTESLQASPLRTFLVLVSIHLLSMVAFSYLIIQRLIAGPSHQPIPPKQCPLCGHAKTMKTEGNDTTSRSD